MPRSMTAYARALSPSTDGIVWIVEIHSVNRKMLDIHMHLARELLFLDVDLRKILSEQVFRGNVSVKIHSKVSQQLETKLPHLKALKSEWERAATGLGYSKGAISLPFLLEQMEKTPSDEELITTKAQNQLKKTVKEALDTFLKMKFTEGKALSSDIAKRLKILLTHLTKIEKQALAAPEVYRKRLLERLSTLLDEVKEDERILREIALFAERADVTEEITRLRSHIEQTKTLLTSKEPSIGRTLDFLTQEMLRESNTIASKSADLKITQLAIALKSEIEKIREQVHNIE